MKITRLGMRSTYSEHVGTTRARYWMGLELGTLELGNRGTGV